MARTSHDHGPDGRRRHAHAPGAPRRRWVHGSTASGSVPAVPRPARRTTVWPCLDADPLPGTALLAGWLARTIITVVTGYTSPGQRVLLYAPPHLAERRRLDSRGAAETDRDPFAGLGEAAWTIARLGRGIDTATAPPTPPADPIAADQPAPRGSASQPQLTEPGPHTPRRQDRPQETGRHPETRQDHREDGRDTDPRGFDLIFTAVRPSSVGWLRATNWPRLLTPGGILAVITHSDHTGGRLVDPIHTLAATFRHHGLGWLDHVIVLTTPPEPPAQVGASTGPRPHPVRHRHYDLLLFATGALAAPARPWRAVERGRA